MKALLKITSDPKIGESLTVQDGETIRIGRTKKADFVIDQARSLSSLHFSLSCKDGQCRLQDLESKNGTWVNDDRVANAVLRHGDTIMAGGVTFLVELEDIASEIPNTSTLPPLSGQALASVPAQTQAILSSSTMTQAVPEKKRAMPIGAGPRQFYVELYEEHLEESSALYEQRLSLLDDPELTWLDIGEFEERLEAHLDALVVGEDLALEICERQAEEGDFGELFAAVCVFCRQRRWDLVVKFLDVLDSEDEERMGAIRDALKFELPVEWQEQCLEFLSESNKKFSLMVPHLVGYGRWKIKDTVLTQLIEEASKDQPEAVSTLGRIGEPGTIIPLFREKLSHEEEPVAVNSAMNLLRLGDETSLPLLEKSIRTADWALLPLALSGDQSFGLFLQSRLVTQQISPAIVTSLGLVGDSLVVEPLIKLLEDPELGEPVAIALNLITGADLDEDVWIPEEIDEDELFEEELEKWKTTGERPMRPDGKPFGESVVRLSQNPEHWQGWWKAHQSKFTSGLRYRRGLPYSPASLLDTLLAETSPRRVRQWAYDELTIRYGMNIEFETDMWVVQQQQALSKIAQWVKANDSRFQSGTWYFAGKPFAMEKV